MNTAKPNVKAEGSVSAITESIWWVGRGAWGGLPALTTGGSNVFLIRGERFDVLVDAGDGFGIRELERNIRRAGSDPFRVREIWMTHSHWDHLGNAAAWQRKYPHVAVRLSWQGVRYLKKKDYRLVGVPLNPSISFEPPGNVRPLRDGQALRCPPFEFRAVHLPGHTPDCVGFRGNVDGLDAMFTGDAIIGDQGPVRGVIGWLDGLWQSDIQTYERTIRAVLRNPPQLILPGHGVPSYGTAARRSLRNCLWRIRKILAIPHCPTTLPIFH